MPRELRRGGVLPRGPFHFRGGLGGARAGWNFRFVLVPRDPDPPRSRLDHRHRSKEEGHLATW